jgi:hypothetical protein
MWRVGRHRVGAGADGDLDADHVLHVPAQRAPAGDDQAAVGELAPAQIGQRDAGLVGVVAGVDGGVVGVGLRPGIVDQVGQGRGRAGRAGGRGLDGAVDGEQRRFLA